jgi:hypothetical protein
MDYLAQVSIFGSLTALLLILGANWAFTLAHILQEWKGEEVPLWRVFGAIVGVFVPNRFGFLVFTVGLCLALWLIGLMAIAGWLPIIGSLPHCLGVWALGVLVGARVTDSVISHWLLYGLAYRPNPGLSSTALYVLEAIFIIVTFHKGFAAFPVAASVGFALGAVAFILVLPSLRLLPRICPRLRRDPWERGRPIPEWAKE